MYIYVYICTNLCSTVYMCLSLCVCVCSYNNQWMVVDYKKFERGQAQLQNGLLWVLEQLPYVLHKQTLCYI